MKKSRFTESQIVSILKQADSGLKVEQLCREHGCYRQLTPLLKRASKNGGITSSDLSDINLVNAVHFYLINNIKTLLGDTFLSYHISSFDCKKISICA